MRRTVLPLIVILAATSLLPARSDPPRTRSVRLGNVTLSPSPAHDLVFPEGRTRWDLTGATSRESWTRRLEVIDKTVLVIEERPGLKGSGHHPIHLHRSGGGRRGHPVVPSGSGSGPAPDGIPEEPRRGRNAR